MHFVRLKNVVWFWSLFFKLWVTPFIKLELYNSCIWFYNNNTKTNNNDGWMGTYKKGKCKYKIYSGSKILETEIYLFEGTFPSTTKQGNYLSSIPSPIPVLLIVRETPHHEVSFHNFRSQDVVFLVLSEGFRLVWAFEAERFWTDTRCLNFNRR